MHRIIFIHCGPFVYQEFTLGGHVGLGGRWPMASQALGQALGLVFDAQAADTLLWQWLREPSARLIFEVKGPKGWFLLLGLGGEEGPTFYLIPTDYEPELFWDGKRRLRSVRQLWQGLKARKVKVSPALASLGDYLNIARQGGPGQARYYWLANQPLDLWRQTQHYLLHPEAGAWTKLMGGLLAWQPDQPSVPLRLLRDKLREMVLTYDEVQRLRAQLPALQAWHQAYQRYQQGQAEAEALQQQLRAEADHLRGLAQRALDAEAQAQVDQSRAWQRHQVQRDLVEREIERSLLRLGALESGGQPIPPDALQQLQAMQQEAEPLQQQLAELQAQYQRQVDELIRLDPISPSGPPAGDWAGLLAAREEQVQHRWQLGQTQQALRDLEHGRQQELKQLEAAEKAARDSFEAESAATAQTIEALQERIKGAGQTFLGWLQDRYPDWEENIGKVVREEVLFHPYLSPSVERLNDLLFGVSLDLSELEAPITGTRHLQEQLEEKQGQQAQRAAAWQAEQEAFQKQRQNAEKRYKSRSAQLQREVQQLTYALEQATLREKRRWNQVQEATLKTQQNRERRKLALHHRLAQVQAEQQRVQALWTQHQETWRARLAQWSAFDTTSTDEALVAERQRLIEWRAQARQLEASTPAAQVPPMDEAAQAREVMAWLDEPTELTVEADPSGTLSLVQAHAYLLRYQHLHQALKEQEQDLRTQAQPLLAQMRPDNVCQFPTDTAAEDWWGRWSEAVSEWALEAAWDRLEDELGQRYQSLISEVAELLPALDAEDQRVRRRLRLLNQRLAQEGKGELQLRPGALLTRLQAVQQLHREQGLALQGASLFAQNQNPDLPAQALVRLRELQAALERVPGDSMNLEEAWEVAWQQTDAETTQLLSEDLLDWPAGLALVLVLTGWASLKAERGEAPLPFWLPEVGRLDGETLTQLVQVATEADLHLLMTGAQVGPVDQMARAYWLQEQEGAIQAVLLMEKE